jgi:hypothetical protein
MRKMMLLAGSIIPVCSSGSIGHGGSGRGTIAALHGEIGVSLPGSARACRVHGPARVVGGAAAHRQKPYSNSSRRWGFDMSQSCCAAGIPEDRVGSTAQPHATAR